MEEILEIGGKEYIFTVNRKAICMLSDLQEKNDKTDMLDAMFYALLKIFDNTTLNASSTYKPISHEL